jgi:pSer/pThr/pTyr-binding forkhead associated (FHA) protein
LLPRFGGRLVKTLGDGVMCAFPDAEKAVLAMCTLHAEISLAPPEGHPVQLHTGINFGPVIVEGQDFYGTIVNVAAYLAAMARAEQILTTRAVVDRLSPATAPNAHAIYSTKLKGDEEDSTIYEIAWQHDPSEITARNIGRLRVVPPDDGALLLSTAASTLSVDRANSRAQLGRDAVNDLIVRDHLVSRRHATIELEAVRFRIIDHSANGTYIAFDGSPGEVHLLRGEALLHGSGKISLGRSLADPLAQPVVFRRDQRSLYRV